MDASQLPKGQSTETPGNGRPQNEPGIYHHPAADKTIITQAGSDGVIQADALVRVGYVRTGDVPSREKILEMQKAQVAKEETEALKLKAEAQAKADKALVAAKA